MKITPRSTSAAIALMLLGSTNAAWADDRSDCTANAGTLLSGVVIGAPTYVSGKPLKGIPLSHTHIRIRGDSDGQTYDLAVDDVFAAGFDVQRDVVPPPLDTIGAGTHVEACGIPYAGGMHWVHTNCGDTPTAQDPNGWLKVVDAAGAAGPNLEDSPKYCYLWPKGGSTHKRHRKNSPSTY